MKQDLLPDLLILELYYQNLIKSSHFWTTIKKNSMQGLVNGKENYESDE